MTDTAGRVHAEGRDIVADDGTRYRMRPLADGEVYVAITEAHARRWAACWNACEGIPTEALEQGVVAQAMLVLAGMKGAAKPT